MLIGQFTEQPWQDDKSGLMGTQSTDLSISGLDDADIVRLSELIAFLSYQIRVIAGLRLMAEVA